MSQIRLVKYESKLEETWDHFIDNSINGTLFHRQKLIGYHAAGRFNDCSLLFYENQKLVAVFPAAIVSKDGKKILKSHPGTSYGGFVFTEAISLKLAFALLEVLHKFCGERHLEQIEFRCSERIFYKMPIEQFEFALVYHGYERKEQELSTFFKLDEFIYQNKFEKFLEQFPQKNRNEIRKGLKECLSFKVLETKEDRASFYEILSKGLMERYNRTPAHSLDEIEKILELFPADCFLLGIFKKDKLTAGFLVMRMNAQGWHIFYAPIDYQFQHARPLNFGVARLIQYAMEQKIQFLNYGVSTPGGTSINWGLLQFKENFKGTGAIRTYWVKQLRQA